MSISPRRNAVTAAERSRGRGPARTSPGWWCRRPPTEPARPRGSGWSGIPKQAGGPNTPHPRQRRPHHSVRRIVMITTDPAAVVTRYIYAVRDGDSGAMRDSFAEDAVWEYPGDLPLSGTWRGRDTIVDDFLGSVGTALEPGSTVALEVTSVLTAGDQVVAEWTSRATARGGAAYHNRNVGIFTVRDGKMAAVREYTDTQHAAHVLFGQS